MIALAKLHSDLLSCVASHPRLDAATRDSLASRLGSLVAVTRTHVHAIEVAQSVAGRPDALAHIAGPKAEAQAALALFMEPITQRAISSADSQGA